MKLLKSTKNEISKHKNCETVRYLEINEVVLITCNIAKNCKILTQKFYIFKNIYLIIFINWSMIYWLNY